MVEMKACPICGAWLTAKLVDSVMNPNARYESCPRYVKQDTKKKQE